MYAVNNPHDFADYLLGELKDGTNHWPDDVPRPPAVDKHTQGQTYVRFNHDAPAETALYVIQMAEQAGLRVTARKSAITISEPRSECVFGGCYADAKGSSPYRDLCPKHARKVKRDKPAGVRAPEYYDE